MSLLIILTLGTKLGSLLIEIDGEALDSNVVGSKLFDIVGEFEISVGAAESSKMLVGKEEGFKVLGGKVSG